MRQIAGSAGLFVFACSAILGQAANGKIVTPAMAAPAATPNPGDSASEPAPSLAALVQRDPGLKLEEKKAPVDVLAIDRIDKVPIEN